jgi:hypothetical protein
MLIGRSQLRFFSKLAPCLAFARDGQACFLFGIWSELLRSI